MSLALFVAGTFAAWIFLVPGPTQESAWLRPFGGNRGLSSPKLVRKTLDTPHFRKAAQQEDIGSLKGRIVARSKGWPIPGALVQARLDERVLSECTSDGQGWFLLPRPIEKDLDWQVFVTGPHVSHETVFPRRILEEHSPWPLQVSALVSFSGRVQADWVQDLWRGQFLLLAETHGDEAEELSSGNLGEDGAWQAWLPLEEIQSGVRVLLHHPEARLESRSVLLTSLRQDVGEWALDEGLTLRGRVESPFPRGMRSAYVEVRVEEGLGMTEMGYSLWGVARSRGQLRMRSRLAPIDANGEFRMRGLRAQSYWVRLLPPGGGMHWFSKERMDEHSLQVEVEPDSEPIELQEWWSLVRLETQIPPGQECPRQVALEAVEPGGPRGSIDLDRASGMGVLPVEPLRAGAFEVADWGILRSASLHLPAVPAGQWQPVTVKYFQAAPNAGSLIVEVADPEGGNALENESVRGGLDLRVYRERPDGAWDICQEVIHHASPEGLSIENLAHGSYRMMLSLNHRSDMDWVPLIWDVRLDDRGSTHKRVEFESGNPLVVECRDAAGQVLPMRLCEWLYPDGSPPLERPNGSLSVGEQEGINLYQGQSGVDGLFRTTYPLPPGEWLLRIYDKTGTVVIAEELIQVETDRRVSMSSR